MAVEYSKKEKRYEHHCEEVTDEDIVSAVTEILSDAVCADLSSAVVKGIDIAVGDCTVIQIIACPKLHEPRDVPQESEDADREQINATRLRDGSGKRQCKSHCY